MTIAGGIAAALYSRSITGRSSVVDVSLIGVGAWATQFSVNLALMAQGPLPTTEPPEHGSATNPLIGAYRTADGRYLELAMLQPGRYWPEFCALAQRPDLIDDERFDTVDKIMANAAAADKIVADLIAAHPLAHWVDVLSRGSGQWSVVQDAWEVPRTQRCAPTA
jgi:crotonobetainyl-CoA:carnitine CoA-transferase CaiB-like acyl-CoA transferase